MVFTVCGILSLLFAAGTLIGAVRAHRRVRSRARILPPLVICIVGMFIAVFLIFIPVYYVFYDFGDQFLYIRPCLKNDAALYYFNKMAIAAI